MDNNDNNLEISFGNNPNLPRITLRLGPKNVDLLIEADVVGSSELSTEDLETLRELYAANAE